MAIIVNSLRNMRPRGSRAAALLKTARSQAVARQQKPAQAYLRSLQFNRNYEELMRSCENGTLPAPPQELGEDLFAREEEDAKERDKVRLKRAAKSHTAKKEKRRKADKVEKVWCAHCNAKHAADFHKKQQMAPKRAPHISYTNAFGPLPPEPESSDTSSEMDDFIVPDNAQPEVTEAIRKMFKYDPLRHEEEDDRNMEAGYEEILKAERHTARIGRLEDAIEQRKARKH